MSFRRDPRDLLACDVFKFHILAAVSLSLYIENIHTNAQSHVLSYGEPVSEVVFEGFGNVNSSFSAAKREVLRLGLQGVGFGASTQGFGVRGLGDRN